MKFDNFKTETTDFTRKLKEYYHVKDIGKIDKISKFLDPKIFCKVDIHVFSFELKRSPPPFTIKNP
jgi:hypothetical protein